MSENSGLIHSFVFFGLDYILWFRYLIHKQIIWLVAAVEVSHLECVCVGVESLVVAFASAIAIFFIDYNLLREAPFYRPAIDHTDLKL